MALTAALVRATPYTLCYLLTHDGAAGDTVTIAHATLQADAVAGPLRDLLFQAVADNAEARLNLLGDGADEHTPHAVVELTPRSAVAVGPTTPSVDAIEESGFADILFASTAAEAVNFYAEIKFAHTYDR